MSNYEEEVRELLKQGGKLPAKIDTNMVKYFWQSNPLIARNKHTIPRFLRELKILQNITDMELHTLSKYLHLRHFNPGESVFKQGQEGIAFYFVYSGQVDIDVVDDFGETRHVITLEKGDYFGELSILQESSLRGANCSAKNSVQLLAILKPDVEEMIKYRPVVAAKFIQSLSTIVASRLYSITKEVGELKHRINQMDAKNASD